jgi:transcriptional regulator with XRE-family HTH domain
VTIPNASARHAALAREFIRALRGKRSQAALSRRLGFTSNVLYRWEAGQREPTMDQCFRLAKAVGIDVRKAMVSFDGRLDAVLPRRVGDHRFVPNMFECLWTESIAELSRRTGLGASSLSRLLSGKATFKLPDFLHTIEASTGRILDWIAAFIDPARLPSAHADWERLQLAREAAQLAPYSEGVLALLETVPYRAHKVHPDGYIAERLGVPLQTELDTIALLVRLGWIRRRGENGPYEVQAAREVDTRVLPQSAYSRLKEFWADEARRSFGRGGAPRMSYVVFSTSEERMHRIGEILREAYFQVRVVLREPESESDVTRAGVATLMLFPIDGQPL